MEATMKRERTTKELQQLAASLSVTELMFLQNELAERTKAINQILTQAVTLNKEHGNV
jgi:hypothetical protein